MSYSQHEADLITENRELRERLKGALADNEVLVKRLELAADHHARLDLRLQEAVRQRNELIQKLDRLRGDR